MHASSQSFLQHLETEKLQKIKKLAFNVLNNAKNRVRDLIPDKKEVKLFLSLVCSFCLFDKWLKLQYKYPGVGKELTRVLRK